MDQTSAALVTGTCRHECRTTCASGPHAVDGGPGEVRRCEHGRLWVWEQTETGYFYNLIHVWRRLSPVWNPIYHRRASSALAPAAPAPPAGDDERGAA